MHGLRVEPHGERVSEASEFRELFEDLSKATEALKKSHDELLRRVGELEAELARKNRALERKHRLEALGKLAAGVAHEIRNPLGSLALYLDLLEEQIQGNEEALSLVKQMRRAVDHLSATVKDILNFTEPGEPRKEVYEPCEILEEALALATAELNGSVEIKKSYPPERKKVIGDPDWVRRILLNLVRNACEAMPGGGVLELGIEYEPEGVVLSVRDSGPGIEEEDLDKVFLPFWGKKEGGTGMGLSIVHTLVEKQGGCIELSNRPEGGLEAKVFLPWKVGHKNASCFRNRASNSGSPLRREKDNTGDRQNLLKTENLLKVRSEKKIQD